MPSLSPSVAALRCRRRSPVSAQATHGGELDVAYKAFLRMNGKALTGMAWKSFQDLGRGAVFVNQDASSQASLYVPLDKWLMQKPSGPDDLDGMDRVVTRIREYDP